MRRFVLGLALVGALAACGHEPRFAVSRPVGGNRVITVSGAASNVYFIEADRGYVMVDAGMAAGAEAVRKLLSAAGIEPAEVSLIVVTHAHPDHVAGLLAAKELSGAPVLCHRSAAQRLSTGRSEPIVGHGPMGALIAAVCPKGFGAVEPDVLVDDELSLKGYGLEGTIVHAPGHTAGSLMILLSSGEVLVGDQVRGASAELSLGQFYEDRALALQSLQRVIGPATGVIHMSHGTHTDVGNLAGFIEMR